MGKYQKVLVRKNAKLHDDKDLIPVKCNDCGIDFTLTYGVFRRKKNKIIRCKSCDAKFKSISYKEKYNNLDEEGKKNYIKGIDNYYNKLDDKGKEEWSKQSSKHSNEFWSSKDDDYKKEFGKKVKSGFENRSSDEKKRLHSQRVSQYQKQLWSKLSYDEKLIKMKPLFDGSEQFWSNITDEERLKVYKKVSDGLYQYYANEDPEHKRIRYERIGISRKRYWESLSDDLKIERMKQLWDGQSSSAMEILFEIIIQDMLLVIGVDYNTQFNTFDIKYQHPDFYKIFPKINPITKYENFPYHSWDFKINNMNGNNILIDIDGSIHFMKKAYVINKKGLSYNLVDDLKFYDSQRPYQIPDNMDAYILQCPNDELNNDNKVIKLTSGSTEITEMTFKDLIDIIKISQIKFKK